MVKEREVNKHTNRKRDGNKDIHINSILFPASELSLVKKKLKSGKGVTYSARALEEDFIAQNTNLRVASETEDDFSLLP